MSKSKKQIAAILACEYAVKWIDSLIEAHTTEYNSISMKYEVPPGHKQFVSELEADKNEILQFHRSFK